MFVAEVRGEHFSQEAHFPQYIEAPVGDGDIKLFAEEAGVEGTAVADFVAVGGVDVIALAVAAEFFVAGEQVGDVELVFDEHGLGEVPDDGPGGGEVVFFMVGEEDAADALGVLAGVVQAAPLDEIIDADGDVAHGLAVEFAAGAEGGVGNVFVAAGKFGVGQAASAGGSGAFVTQGAVLAE